MKCIECTTTLIGKFCHECGTKNASFSRLVPLTFAEISKLFTGRPNPKALVEKHGTNRINAIKEYRELTGMGLIEAKEAIDEAYFERYPERRGAWSING